MKYLMNIYTGSVDEEENWNAEGFYEDEEDGLMHVEKDTEGNWIEVKL